MTRYTNSVTGVTVNIDDADQLPPPASIWVPGDGTSSTTRTRRRADTGSVPVQSRDGR